ADLRGAVPLLPVTALNGWKTKPTKPAAYAMLARVYLAMQNYDSAKKFADSCLQLSGTLMDYNSDASINRSAQYPFARYNSEVLFHSLLIGIPMMAHVTGNGYVDTSLYALYSANDL